MCSAKEETKKSVAFFMKSKRCTTNVFLRKFSTFEISKDNNVSLNKSEIARIDDKTDSAHLINSLDFSKPQVSEKDWLFCTSPISKILSHASKNSKTIIVSLSKRLGLTGDDRFDEADKKINEYKKKRDELSKTKKQKENECKQLKNKIKESGSSILSIHNDKIVLEN